MRNTGNLKDSRFGGSRGNFVDNSASKNNVNTPSSDKEKVEPTRSLGGGGLKSMGGHPFLDFEGFVIKK